MAKSSFEKILEEFDYNIPSSLIAQNPASPRDSAKLLVYNKKLNKTSIDTFNNLAKYLPPKSVLVLNKTKVIPARITAKKNTGGKVELLYSRSDNENIFMLSNKNLSEGARISINQKTHLTLVGKTNKEYIFKPSFKASNIIKFLEKYGKTPLPPYIKHTTLNEENVRKEYQTIFAKKKGSVAAPTASLHFTNSLLKRIRKEGHTVCFITLHVNLGTFAPLTEKQFEEKKLHKEWFEIDKKTALILNKAKLANQTIISVGTTVTRTLESAVNAGGKIDNLCGTTNLLIDQNYKLKFVNGIITNFHVPKSSLLMLVSSFVGREKLFKLYNTAIKQHFRFFSFGDGMLIV